MLKRDTFVKAIKFLVAGFVFGGVVLALLPDTNASDLTQPTLVIKANGVQDRLTIMPGTDVQISWASSNVSSCSLNNNSWTGLAGEGYSTGPVYSNITIDGSCKDASGQVVVTSRVDIDIISEAPPISTYLSMKIDENDSKTITLPAVNNGIHISWSSTNALECNINGWTPKSGTGWATGPLTSSLTIPGRCLGHNGDSYEDELNIVINQVVTESVNINTVEAPRIDFSGNPQIVPNMSSTTLTWRSINASSCIALEGEGFTTSGLRTTTLGSDISSPLNANTRNTFTISCTGPGGTTTASWTPIVIVPSLSAAISISPSKVTYGTAPKVVVSWSSTSAVICRANTEGLVYWQTGGATSGSVVVSPPDPSQNLERKEPTGFSVYCSDASGTNSYAYTSLTWVAPDMVCAPASQTVFTNTPVTVSVPNVSGVKSWIAPGGSPASGSGTSFTTQYATAGTKTISLMHNIESKVTDCEVNVLAPPTTVRSVPTAFGFSFNRPVSSNKPWLSFGW